MSQTQSSPQTTWTRTLDLLQRFGAIFLVIAIAAGGYYVSHYLLPGADGLDDETSLEDALPTDISESVVLLTDEKLQLSGLTTHRVELRDFQPHKTVPGSIAYNARSKVEMRASVQSVVRQCLVRSRQQVKAGDSLLVLDAPEIGQARIAVDKAKANLKLAETEHDWAQITNENLLELIEFLHRDPTVEQVNQRFADKTLGEHRGQVLSAYSQFLLAKKNVERSNPADAQGAIAGRVLDERKSELEVAGAKFLSLIEESKFQSGQDLGTATYKSEAAQKDLEISQEQLNMLLGPYGNSGQPDDAADELALIETSVDASPTTGAETLSEFVLTAPRDGQVVELFATQSSRIVAGEVMLTIADTNNVWVEAHIPQRDLPTLDLVNGQVVSVSVPGIDGRQFLATIQFSDAVVSPTTLAVSFVAEMNNTDHTFRPGMFVWVSVPIGEMKKAIAVPIGAVQHGQETFVFLSEGGGTFRRQVVELGTESEGWIEIKAGLKSGDQIVDNGAFFLKSELLLEPE